VKSSDGSRVESLSESVVLARLDPVAFAYLMDQRYEPGEVHYRIGKKLRELEEGTVDRLAIMAPPRHGKSELCSVHFIAWYLGLHPDSNVIFASYNQDAASKVAARVRDIVASPQFRIVFPGVVLSSTAATDRWTIPGHRGGFLAAGVGGTMTGFGADLFVIDDPIKNMEEATSAHMRDALFEWLNTVALSRLEPRGRMLLLMQRWHIDDLVGRIKQQTIDGEARWEIAEFAALSPEGDPLWPERFSREELEDRRASIDINTWSAMWMQQPLSEKGKVFERDWFPRYPIPNALPVRCVGRYIAVDTANKDGEQNDFSAAVVVDVMTDYQLWVRQVWRGRVKFPVLLETIESLINKWNRDGMLSAVLVEDAASGTSVLQALSAVLPYSTYELVPWTPRGSKSERARAISAALSRGAVALPHPSDDVPWLFEFENELFEFPGRFDDQVDALVHLVDYLGNYVQERLQYIAALRRLVGFD
jgi:predicted phage terminase large subunit-like protein